MKLFSRRIGSGHPLLIIHGLYGSSDNWWSIARKLADYFEVHAIDLRNHGQSPWNEAHNYNELCSDIVEYLDDNSIQRAILLGHSMGGKAAIYTTVNFPQRVSRLIVADMSPLSYTSRASHKSQMDMHLAIINAMSSVDFSKVNSISDADNQLKTTLKAAPLRQFLLKNLKHNDGKYSWRLNLEVIRNSLNFITDGFSEADLENGLQVSSCPVCFIRGEKSEYIKDEDVVFIKKMFSHAIVRTIPEAGHWLHAEQPEIFCKEVKNFVFG